MLWAKSLEEKLWWKSSAILSNTEVDLTGIFIYPETVEFFKRFGSPPTLGRNMHMLQHRCLLLVGLFLFCFAGATQGLAVDDLQIFRIGTGGQTGVYYPMGKLIAGGLTGQCSIKGDPGAGKTGVVGCIAVAQNSAGSEDNINSLMTGEIEAGLVQADVAFHAFRSAGPFAGQEKYGKLRAIASLYVEKFQIVVRKNAGIESVHDLKNKRISLDEKGSGTLGIMRIVLNAHSMSEKHLKPVYLKPVFTESKMLSGDLDGFVMMAGTPMEAVQNLAHIGIRLVPISRDMILKINTQYPYLTPGSIPAGVYPGVGEVTTIQVHALLAVSAEMEKSLAYDVTRTLWSPQMLKRLEQGHPQGRSVTLETALAGLSIPLHDGAKQYYREIGYLSNPDNSQ